MTAAFGLAEIQAAAARLHGRIRTTPLLASARLDALVQGNILLKVESLQETGSFKARGALHALLSLGAEDRGRGVIAYSSGNHALAVSWAAALLRFPAVVVMPRDAPAPKIQGARRNGAEVVLYDRQHDDREALCRALASERGLALVPPYDDFAVMAGQGTVALEALQQAQTLGMEVDDLLVPCSGGGLAAGCAAALEACTGPTRLFTVEPSDFDDMARSLASGAWERNPSLAGSVCDALLVPSPGRLTLPVLRGAGARGLRVSDSSVRAAMRFALEHLRLVVEPGGAAALAAILQEPAAWRGRTAVLVLSGGNADPDLLRDVLQSAETFDA